MSVSPAKTANGGARAPAMRKKAPVSVFQPKKKVCKRPVSATSYTPSGQAAANGVRPSGTQLGTQPRAQRLATNGVPTQTPPAQDDDPSTYQEFPIVVEKSALMRGFHYHGFRLQSRVNPQGKLEPVDPYNEADFTRPVRLYRRRAQDKAETAEQSDVALGVADKEREMREAKRLERQAEREANQAMIAPTDDRDKAAQRRPKQQKRVVDVLYDDNSPRNKLRSQLRYEEARRWHLEDFDGKNKWVGGYEAPLSQKHVLFEISDAGFRMVPVEKWYRMIPTDKVKVLSEAQVEKMMTAKHRAPRWFMSTQEAARDAKMAAIAAKREQMANARRAKTQADDDAPAYVKNEEYRADVDEIDFEFNDEFQDDDEGFVFGEQPDEDSKEIEKRIREEMRHANLPDANVKGADEGDWVNEEREKREADEEERKRQKRIRKQLKKKELRHEYESDDSDLEKYMESSESEDSDEERERLEGERKKEEESKKAAEANGARSGKNSGTNTPSGRLEKRPMKRDADVSDLSSNESSRKKAKLSGTPAGPVGAPSLSADPAGQRILSGYGSGSDTDTSRTGRKLKLKHSPPGAPLGPSRAGSPAGSRAPSPARAPLPSGSFPTLEDVKAAIPNEGVVIGDLVKAFKVRLTGRNAEFIALVKQAGRQDAATKKIVPKD